MKAYRRKILPYRAIGIKGAAFTMKDYQKLVESVKYSIAIATTINAMQTVLERTLKRCLTKFLCLKRQIYESMNAMQIGKYWWKTWRQRARDSMYYRAWTTEKEVQEVTQQAENAFVDIAALVVKWMPEAVPVAKNLVKTDNAPLPLKKIEGSRMQVTAERTVCCNMSQHAWRRFVTTQAFSHLFIDEVQDVSLLWLEPYSTFISVRNSRCGRYLPIFSTATTIFHLWKTTPEPWTWFCKPHVNAPQSSD